MNSRDFIDLPPVQIYARLLDAGIYLCSISTFYRVLEENRQVKERRRQARQRLPPTAPRAAAKKIHPDLTHRPPPTNQIPTKDELISGTCTGTTL